MKMTCTLRYGYAEKKVLRVDGTRRQRELVSFGAASGFGRQRDAG